VNFFAAQDQARRMSRNLILAYLAATLIIVLGVTAVVGLALYGVTETDYGATGADFMSQQAPLLIATALGTTLLILGATAYKTAALSAGGGKVARDLGGVLVTTDSQDPLHRRLRNVVEEMAIASGTPVPEIYVLEQEGAINAFAAGYEPGDAAVAVTRGALELLDREELQGVIAHEFSHILNGDMRLNIRLMGVLFGIMVLALIGRTILRGARYGAFVSNRRNKGAPVILVIGIGLAILGGIGILIARVIKASVSRQREFLADASAVQFTRQTRGIADALKKIGGYRSHSYLQAADAEEISHMLFGSGAKLSGLFATHPPLTARIQALEPDFRPEDFPAVDSQARPSENAGDERLQAGFAAAQPASASPLAQSITDLVGQPGDAQMAYASRLRDSLPDDLYAAAHSVELAYLLVIALLLDRSERLLDQQLALTEQQLGRARAEQIRQYFETLAEARPDYRLPLLELSFPALRRRPKPELDFLAELATRLIEVDGAVDVYEFCFYRILVTNLRQAGRPAAGRPRRRAARGPVRNAAIDLLRIVATYGHDADDARQGAFAAGTAVFGEWGDEFDYDLAAHPSLQELDRSLDMLLALNSEGQQLLLQAVTEVVMYDHKLSVVEGELIRAICATLGCPLPPVLIDQQDA
jgi:Zn-dependent protease with chaperone function